MKKVLLLCTLVIFNLLLIGCTNNLSKYSGTYKLEYYKYVADPDSAKTIDDWILVLEKDGTGKSNRDGGSYSIEWSIKDNNISLKEKFGSISIDYNGTIINNRIDVYNGDRNNDLTLEAVFIKND